MRNGMNPGKEPSVAPLKGTRYLSQPEGMNEAMIPGFP